MDGKSEVWTCSLTRFAWHSLLFRSWIACIGLSLLLIVSFFEDCYKLQSVAYTGQEIKDIFLQVYEEAAEIYGPIG